MAAYGKEIFLIGKSQWISKLVLVWILKSTIFFSDFGASAEVFNFSQMYHAAKDELDNCPKFNASPHGLFYTFLFFLPRREANWTDGVGQRLMGFQRLLRLKVSLDDFVVIL